MTGKPKAKALREIFGLNLRLERTRVGVTQEALAGMIGSDQAYISQIERGTVSPSLDVVERISAALEVTAADLLDVSLGRRR